MRAVHDAAEREAVHAAIPFDAFDRDDPIFALEIERSMWCWWEHVGKPETRPVRRHWRADAPSEA